MVVGWFEPFTIDVRHKNMNSSLPSELEPTCCQTCQFWRRRHSVEDTDDWGECRRMPPSLPEIADEKLVVAGVWPCTKASDWCGEWNEIGPDAKTPDEL